MKKIKYVLTLILFIIGFMFIGEFFMFHLDNFQESYYRANFYFDTVPENVTSNIIIRDFQTAASQNQVDFFTVDFKINSDYHKTIRIYGTKDALTYLKEHEIDTKQYSSLFVGTTDVSLHDFSECETIKKQEQFYFIGDDIEKLHCFKAELVDKYGGGFPKLYGSDDSVMQNIGMIWGIIFLIILLLSVYDITLQQKEYTVLMILGQDLRIIFTKNVLKDLIVFSGCFFLVPRLLKQWSNTLFYNWFVTLIFLIFLVLDILINLLVFKINIRKNFSNAQNNQHLLQMNYGMKVLTLLMVAIMLSLNAALISEGWNYYKQKEFFQNHSDYCYYQLNYKITENSSKIDESNFVTQNFYKTFYEDSLLYADFTEQFSINYPTILINPNSKSELIQNDSGWKTILENCTHENVYMILPEKFQSSKQFLETLEQINRYTLGNTAEPIVESYDTSTELIGINQYLHNYRSKILKNPIVILDNRKPVITDEMTSGAQLYYAYDILYQIPEDDFEQYISEYDLENEIVKITNAGDSYQYNWAIAKRCIKMVSILSVIMIFLELLMVFLIIKLEYTYNALQITLMQILGYSRLKRNKQLFLITTGCMSVSILLLFGFAYYYKIQELSYAIWSIIFFTVIELIIIILKIRQLERKKIALILKGEQI